MTTWFTSDLHFGHANIIGFCRPQYDHTDQMDDHIFSGLKGTVSPNDTLWILGDIAFRGRGYAEIVAQKLADMPFKVQIVGGNHDRKRCDIYAKHGLLYKATGRHDVDIDGQTVSVGHFPAEPIDRPDQIVLCGHVHTKFAFERAGQNINCNVGWDIYRKPVTLAEILKERDTWSNSSSE